MTSSSRPVWALPMFWTTLTGSPDPPWPLYRDEGRSDESAAAASATATVPSSDMTRVLAVLDAVRAEKERCTQAYLAYVESAVDEYLARVLNFRADAIPPDYLDVPPTDIAAIEVNLGVLQHCLQEVFNPSSHVRKHLLEPLVHRVWAVHLDPLLDMLSNAITVAAECSGDRYVATRIAGLHADVKHLRLMRDLESGFLCESATNGPTPVQRCGPSDVVPIAGIAVGRLHRLHNEHATVAAHWTPQRVTEYHHRRRRRG